jgi:hypothetical protein
MIECQKVFGLYKCFIGLVSHVVGKIRKRFHKYRNIIPETLSKLSHIQVGVKFERLQRARASRMD